MISIEELKDKVMKIIKNISYVNDDGGIEIYLDYRDEELSNNTLEDIIESPNPRERFEEIINDWALDYEIDYGEDELKKDIKKELPKEEIELFEENSDDILEIIRENVYFFYDENAFNNDVYVNIMVDCGNKNYDYTCDNVLNWYGNSGDGSIPEESSVLWLAKTQGKATKLKKACKKVHRNDGNYLERKMHEDKFIEIFIQEF